MKTVSNIAEIAKIKSLVSIFRRAPNQLNKIYESDSEIIDLGLEKNLVLTADALCEEIEWKMISDPYVMGWVNVVSSLSDLAAVAAEPLGVLIGLSHSLSHDDKFLSRFWQGTNDALTAHSTFLLGGDTNVSNSFLVSCTGVGQRSKSIQLSRKGASDGDILYVSGPVGMGIATGFANFVIRAQSSPMADQIELNFRPHARFPESKIISEFASSCIDTSDGLIAALDFLCEINQTQCSLLLNRSHFHPIAQQLSEQVKVPLILFSSIHLGEFELLFTIPRSKKKAFEAKMESASLNTLEIGQIDSTRNVMSINNTNVDLHPIRNLLADLKNPASYLQSQQQWSMPFENLLS